MKQQIINILGAVVAQFSAVAKKISQVEPGG
jgi:hypothetical protein